MSGKDNYADTQIIRPGWLSPSGEFITCEPYEHIAVAVKLVKDQSL